MESENKNQVENWDVDEIGGNCSNEEFEVLLNLSFPKKDFLHN